MPILSLPSAAASGSTARTSDGKGEWHLVNPPERWHPELNSDMFRVLAPLAETLGV